MWWFEYSLFVAEVVEVISAQLMVVVGQTVPLVVARTYQMILVLQSVPQIVSSFDSYYLSFHPVLTGDHRVPDLLDEGLDCRFVVHIPLSAVL